MSLSQERIRYLLSNWIKKNLTPEEEAELMEWLRNAPEDSELQLFIRQLWQSEEGRERGDHVDWNMMYRKILGEEQSNTPTEKTRIFTLSKITAAAAAIAILFLISFWFLTERKSAEKMKTGIASRSGAEILPASDEVVLILADGTSIILDSAADGSLVSQGTTRIFKEGSQLSYAAAAGAEKRLETETTLYNTLKTSKGKQFSLTLGDGTVVWMNAATTIRFPASFHDSERVVELTGEAYFEVKKNANKPFKVKTKDSLEVTVLGTRFNVNAYGDEMVVETSLLQGSVRVKRGRSELALIPGQQARAESGTNGFQLNRHANVDQSITWKDGLFDFENDELPEIMRQLSRWYDIEVVYEGKIPAGHYTGGIRRQVNLSEVLKMLESLGDVKFTVDGRKVIVKTI